MSRLAHWGIGLILLQPMGVWALGLGEIELESALNQPLKAEIRLVSASAEEVDTLKVGLASRDTFDRYGLDRPAYLSDVTFSVGRDSAGRNVIKVESVQSMTEPFVTMLVEATWPRGRLLKEYTVLLDPPVLLPQPQAPATVQAPSTVSQAGQASGRIQRPATQRPQTQTPAQAPARPATPRSFSNTGGGTYGPVQRNETLWRIAEQVRPDAGLTMNQVMVALYQANPGAFDGNINRLRRGAILNVPTGAEMAGLTIANATSEVRRQNEAWRGGAARPGLRLVAPDTTGGASSGQSASTAGDSAQSGALRDEVRALRDEVAERDRLLEVKDQQLQDLQAQLSALQEAQGVDPADMAEPVDPVDDPMADDGATDDPLADDTGLDTDELFADDTQDTTQTDAPADTAEPVTEPVPSVTSVVTTPAEEKGLLGTIMEWLVKPFVWVGGGLLLVLIAGLFFVRKRQESAADITGRWEALEAEADDDTDYSREATARMRAQSEPDSFLVEEAEPGELTSPGIDPTTAEAALEDTPALVGDETLSSQTAINLDQADPVAEADFHMAYGLYDQAADLLEKAVNDEPQRRDLKLKLLEVFFVWDNKDAFRQSAEALRNEIGDGPDADWDKVAIMGKQICPDDELFSEQVAGAAVDVDLVAGGDDAPLDFSLDDSGAGAVDLDFGDAVEDTGQPTATVALDTVDIGAQTAAGLEAAFVEDDEAALTSPDLEGLAETMESPTLESPSMDEPTAETPQLDDATVEMPDASPTVESPTVEIEADAPTMETPTIETPMTELPTIEQPALAGADQTAEIDLDDLGLDLDGIDDLDPTGQEAALPGGEEDTQNREGLGDIDDDLLSATGVTQVLEGDIMEHASTEVLSEDDATMMAPGFDEGTFAGTELLPQADDPDATNRVEVLTEDEAVDPSATSEMQAMGDAGLDLNLDDLSAALDGGETVEQPGSFGDLEVDLDIGSSLSAADDPTATEQVGVMDPQTLTEVGTKLDLARAYIDMGDPEGARSILEEVLSEGDPSQRQEAEGLIGGLSA